MTSMSVYLFTKEIWNPGAGLFAACFIAIVPGYISRSVAGSYDNEGIAIFALMFTYYLWIKAVKTGQVFWSICSALSYFYMVSAWGGYVFIINLVPLHVFVLLLMGRYSQRIYTSYTCFYIVGLILSMQIPFVGFQPIRTSEHMAAAVVLYAIFASYFAGVMVRLMLTLTPVVCVLAAIAFSKTFEVYLKDDSPKSNQKGGDENGDNKNDRLYDKVGNKKKIRDDKPKDDEGLGINVKSIIIVALLMMLMLFAVHCTWVTSSAYSSPSIVLASYGQGGSRTILDDFREAYYWLRQNTHDKARIMSWWDYGYQIAGMGNRTTLVDNNTWNNSHIALYMGGIILPHLQLRSNNPTPINAPIIKQSPVQLPQGSTAAGISMDSQMEMSSPLNNPC
ncbi:dolichyl-diphosphooligosaccharide--protein glycosyltransferase subunit STT3B [Elysia marginata]|uniref:dolichyl-diphosphooligosaccharide--protein glycotransferase n=1 Tax=Elysia marginata TaxID=1093978 RepID=A0AAV4IMZ2_9GAST|nr:dolichyl-diphosphooligosaccharide--protein glycosyltransferase subunit STT3B [Elysia marginata]